MKKVEGNLSYVGKEEMSLNNIQEVWCSPLVLLRGYNYRALQEDKVALYAHDMELHGYNPNFPILAKPVHKTKPFPAIKNGEEGELPAGDYLEILAGNHRHEAALRQLEKNPLFRVLVRITTDSKNIDFSKVSYLSNVIAQHSPVEEGNNFLLAMKQNRWKIKDIADYYSLTEAYVKERVDLVGEGAKELIRAVVDGKVPKTTALALIKLMKTEENPEVSQSQAVESLTKAQEHSAKAQENIQAVQQGVFSATGEWIPSSDLVAISQGEEPSSPTAQNLSTALKDAIAENIQQKQASIELEREVKSVPPSEARAKAVEEYGVEIGALWELAEMELADKGIEGQTSIPYVGYLKPYGPCWHHYSKDLQDQLFAFFKVPKETLPPAGEPETASSKRGLTPTQVARAMVEADPEDRDPYWSSHPELWNMLQIMEQHLKLAKSSKQNLEKLMNHVDKGKSGMVRAAMIYGILSYFEAPGFKKLI